MEKLYLSESWLIWILYLLYSLTCYFLFILFFSKFFNSDKKLIILYTLLYFFYSLIPLADFFIDMVPYFPDTNHYSIYVQGEMDQVDDLGYKTTMATYSFLGYFAFQEPFVFLNFQILFYFLSSCFIYKAWVLYTGKYDVGAHRLFLVLYFLYPSMLLFIPTTLRESLFTLAFSVLMYSLFLKNNKYRLIPQLLSFATLLLFRKQLAILTGLYIIGFYTLKKMNLLVRVATILTSFFVITRAMLFIGVTPGFISGIRMWLINKYKHTGMTYGEVQWESYFDIVRSIPQLSLQFLLVPLPIATDINPLQFKALLIDLCFIIVIVFFFIISKAHRKHVFWTLFIVSLIVFPAGYEFAFPGAARHRIPAILLMIPAAAAGLYQFKFLGRYKLYFGRSIST